MTELNSFTDKPSENLTGPMDELVEGLVKNFEEHWTEVEVSEEFNGWHKEVTLSLRKDYENFAHLYIRKDFSFGSMQVLRIVVWDWDMYMTIDALGTGLPGRNQVFYAWEEQIPESVEFVAEFVNRTLKEGV